MSPCHYCHEYFCPSWCIWSHDCEACGKHYENHFTYFDGLLKIKESTYESEYGRSFYDPNYKHTNCNVHKCCGAINNHKELCVFSEKKTKEKNKKIKHIFEELEPKDGKSVKQCKICGDKIIGDINLVREIEIDDYLTYCINPEKINDKFKQYIDEIKNYKKLIKKNKKELKKISKIIEEVKNQENQENQEN